MAASSEDDAVAIHAAALANVLCGSPTLVAADFPPAAASDESEPTRRAFPREDAGPARRAARAVRAAQPILSALADVEPGRGGWHGRRRGAAPAADLAEEDPGIRQPLRGPPDVGRPPTRGQTRHRGGT